MLGRLFLLALFFCLGFIAQSAIARFSTVPIKTASVQPVQLCPEVNDAALLAENVRLKNQLLGQRQQPSLQMVTPKNIPAPASPDTKANDQLQQELAQLRAYKSQSEFAKYEERMNALGATPANMVKVFRENFSAEPINETWAKQNKQQLVNAFTQQEKLSSLPVGQSECRSQQCRIELLSDQQFTLAQLQDSVGELVGDQGQQFNSYTLVVDPNTHSTSIYFAR